MAHEIRALVVQQKKVWDTISAERLMLDHGGHRTGLEGREERRTTHRRRRIDFGMKPLAARGPQRAGIAIPQIIRHPETLRVRVPGTCRLVVTDEHDRGAVWLTGAMAGQRRRRTVDTALCQNDGAGRT